MGANRMHVSLARRWARRGYIVLRMDLAGLGDSGKRPGRPDNDVFSPSALDDVALAQPFGFSANASTALSAASTLAVGATPPMVALIIPSRVTMKVVRSVKP